MSLSIKQCSISIILIKINQLKLIARITLLLSNSDFNVFSSSPMSSKISFIVLSSLRASLNEKRLIEEINEKMGLWFMFWRYGNMRKITIVTGGLSKTDTGNGFVSLLHCTALYCIVLHCTTLYYIVLHCTTLYYIVLHCTTLYYIVLHCTTLYYIVLNCTTLYYIVLHCTTLYYIVLNCTTLYYIVLHCTTLYYIVLHCTTLYYIVLHCTTLY